MEIIKLNCVACGAPISVPDDVDVITCTSCLSTLSIKRGDGYVALKLAELIGRSIEDSGKQTKDAIIESSRSTQNQIQRMQLQYELSTAEMKLSNIQGELRSLQRSGSTEPWHYYELRFIEFIALEELRSIWWKINTLSELTPDNQLSALTQQLELIRKNKSVLRLANQNNINVRNEFERINKEERSLQVKLSKLRRMRLINQLSFSLYIDITSLPKEDVLPYRNLISKDISFLQSEPSSPEQQDLLEKLKEKYNILNDRWIEYEKGRIRGTLRTTNIKDLNALSIDEAKHRLFLVEIDINNLQKEEDSPAVTHFINTLLSFRVRIIDHINNLEKEQKRSDKKAKRAEFIAGITIAISAFFAELFGNSSSKNEVNQPETGIQDTSQEESNRVYTIDQDKQFDQIQQQNASFVIEKSEKQKFSEGQKEEIDSTEKKRLDNELDSASCENFASQMDDKIGPTKPKEKISIIMVGIIASLGVIFSISCTLILIMALFFSDTLDTESSPWTLGITFFPLTLSFLLGSLIFYIIVAPAAGYSFLGIKKPIIPKKSTISTLTIKIFSSVTIILGGILLSLNIAFFLPMDSDNSFIFPCLGIFITLIGAIIPFVIIKDPKIKSNEGKETNYNLDKETSSQ
jgi:hypothetical protein